MAASAVKRLYDEAFERKKLQKVEIGSYYVEHTVYKVLKREIPGYCKFNMHIIQTAGKSEFSYGERIILDTATSATTFTSEKKATKTELIELFSNLSMNDIWCATYYTLDKDSTWQEKMVEKIQSMDKDSALKFVKKNFNTFGKTIRELIGQKVNLKSDNNYYTVRDLEIHFDELTNVDSVAAMMKSIRKVDINTLQSLIFNSVKYILK